VKRRQLEKRDPVSAGDVLDGDYRILDSVIGEGGMGLVVLGQDVARQRNVAIKFIRAVAEDRKDLLVRFRREYELVSCIQSPHVVEVYDCGELGTGELYMVLEYLEGRDLGEVVRVAGDALAVDRVVSWAIHACEALASAHALGIVHRDIKPANLFLTTRADGERVIKVLDFGIAKLLGAAEITNVSQRLNTDGYAPLEQLEAPRSVDGRTDLFAVGATLFKLLTGKLPFGDAYAQQILAMREDRIPVALTTLRPDVPAALERIVVRCLARDRVERFPDARALRDALAPFANARGVAMATAVIADEPSFEEPTIEVRKPRQSFADNAASSETTAPLPRVVDTPAPVDSSPAAERSVSWHTPPPSQTSPPTGAPPTARGGSLQAGLVVAIAALLAGAVWLSIRMVPGNRATSRANAEVSMAAPTSEPAPAAPLASVEQAPEVVAAAPAPADAPADDPEAADDPNQEAASPRAEDDTRHAKDDAPRPAARAARAADPIPAAAEYDGVMNETGLRRLLEGKVAVGIATPEDLRLLRAICAHQGDRPCRDKTAALIKRLSTRP
jgi:serine/threonine-protein kinase